MTKKSETHNFEKLYLRWKYFLKGRAVIKDDQVAAKYVKLFRREILSTSNIIYFKNKSIFDRMGMDIKDIISISQVHLISYIGAFSLIHSEEKLKRYMEKYRIILGREPEEADVLKKDRINFISFLNQRLLEMVNYSVRELQKISINRIKQKYFKAKKISEVTDASIIFDDPKKHNYIPISIIEFK